MTPRDDIEALAERLMPRGIFCAVEPIADHCQALLPAEAVALVRAVPKRRAEFSTGRKALRRAIARAGFDLPRTVALPVGADRRPVLPPGIAVSLSHCADFCIALATTQPALMPGVDLEPVDAELPEGICEIVAPYRVSGLDKAPLLAFCAKEAVYKSQYAESRQMLDFSDVALVADQARFRARLGCGRFLTGRWGLAGGHLLALSWRVR